MNLNALLLIVGVLAFGALVIFVIVPWRLKRAAKKLVRTFREYKATVPEKAITRDELSISSPSLFQFRRDYKLEALNLLIRAEVIKVTEDNKFYLSEERYRETKIYVPPSS